MTRRLAAFAIVALSASTARADGFVKLGLEIAARPHEAATSPGTTAAPAAPAAPAAQAKPTPIDGVPTVNGALFPRAVPTRSARPDLVYVPTTPVEIPPMQGAPLGDDRDWRVQAAQVGVMAGAFAALVALCGDGKCMW